MANAPLKKVKMMDIVRKKSVQDDINPLLGKGQREQFANERKRESLHMEVQKEAVGRNGSANEGRTVTETVIDEKNETQKVSEHPAPRIINAHSGEDRHESMAPSMSSLDMDHPIAYIPKEKTSREEKRVLERIERRERSGGKKHKRVKWGGIVAWTGVCVALGMAAYVVAAVLPRAEITLVSKKANWEYANTISAGTNIAEVDPAGRRIPVAVFLEKKTNVFQFLATGAAKSIERKAIGRVTIYNEFSESSQPLVAGTRLEMPDGKIFRLNSRVVIPGAAKAGGELVAASVEADVTADKAGEVYNVGSISRFTIPGFAGSPKFEGFYASSKDPMTGGFIGESKYPTADDIRMAKESAERQMKDVIEAFLATQVVPEGFRVMESSRKFTVVRTVVNEGVDDRGNFSVYIEAEGGVDALKEAQVLELMTELARQAKGDNALHIKSHTISYGTMAVDAKTGSITLPVDFRGVFWKPIDLDDFKSKVMGKTQDELKAIIFGSDGLDKADVSLWPFWVRTVPNDMERVKVELQ